jgi:hypothetical protein
VVVSPAPPPAASRLRLLPVWWGRGGASSASVGLGRGLVVFVSAFGWGHSFRVLQGRLRCLRCRPLDGAGGLGSSVWRPGGSPVAPAAPPLLPGMGAAGHPPVSGRLQQLAGFLVGQRCRSCRVRWVVGGGWAGPGRILFGCWPPAPHSVGRSASRSEEVEVHSRSREESTPPLRLASDVGPLGSASSPCRSCSPGVDVQVVDQSLGAVALVGMVGSPPLKGSRCRLEGG